MSLSTALISGLTGLRAAQSGIGVVSQNIANANTPGYVRTEVTQAPRSQLGAGGGVEVTAVKRAADRFLATAGYIAEATRGSSAARSDILARAQASFGDPAGETSMFAMLDDFWSALTEISVDPSSSLRRGAAVSSLETMFSEVHRIGESLQDLIGEADQRIGDAVSQAQDLINRIAELNQQIRLNKRTGADASAAENAQSALIDSLSSIIDLRVSPVEEGGVHVRTSGGALLVGVQAATLEYTPNSAPYAAHGFIALNPELGTQSNLEPYLLGGQLKGLLQVRDQDLTGLAEALGGFAAALSDALNEVHNENASSPAVSEMTGRQTGLLGSDALNFSGRAIVGVVNATGELQQRLTIDFDAGQIVGEDPAATYAFAAGTVQSFVAALNTALGAADPPGSADFTGGVLTLDVDQGGGLVVQQDDAAPSARAGRGFSHFFGLNDLVSRPSPIFYDNGIETTDLHGLGSGGEIVYQVRDSMGRFISTTTISISGALTNPASTWQDLLNALNDNTTGLGRFGSFSLDANTGQIGFTQDPAFQVELMYDSTRRGATGVSFSALHGLASASRTARAIDINVNPDVSADPSRLAVGRPDLSADLGARIIEAGDNRGASALVAARDSIRSFQAAGVLGAQSTTLAVYAARLGGEAGRLSTDAERAATGAQAVATAAGDRRAQIEGVSLDDELMKMTVYQNAYSASARVIQAATDMLDILMSLGRR